jgi:site-specific recombinase XerC
MATLDSLFRQFLRERSYLKHVSPKTRVWYETAWATFLRTQPAGLATTPINGTAPITRQRLNAFVVALRDRGVRPVTCNAWLRALNAYCRWLHDEGILAEPTKLPPVEAGEAVREDAGRTRAARDPRVQAERR